MISVESRRKSKLKLSFITFSCRKSLVMKTRIMSARALVPLVSGDLLIQTLQELLVSLPVRLVEWIAATLFVVLFQQQRQKWSPSNIGLRIFVNPFNQFTVSNMIIQWVRKPLLVCYVFVFCIFNFFLSYRCCDLIYCTASLFQLSPPLYLKFTYLNAIALIFFSNNSFFSHDSLGSFCFTAQLVK